MINLKNLQTCKNVLYIKNKCVHSTVIRINNAFIVNLHPDKPINIIPAVLFLCLTCLKPCQ